MTRWRPKDAHFFRLYLKEVKDRGGDAVRPHEYRDGRAAVVGEKVPQLDGSKADLVSPRGEEEECGEEEKRMVCGGCTYKGGGVKVGVWCVQKTTI